MRISGDDHWQRGKVSWTIRSFWLRSEESVFSSKIYVEPSRNGFLSLDTIESTETPTNSQVINGFAVPHSIVSDSESLTLESQAGSITHSQGDEEMDQDNPENEREEEAEEEEEEEDKPSSSSSPTTNLTDENSSSSNSNSTPVPSSSTEDMIEQ